MVEKGIFVLIPIDLYKKLEKVRIDENITQKEFLNKILKNFIQEGMENGNKNM